MTPVLVYLCGPIEGFDQEEARSWREYATKALHTAGITCFNPYTAFTQPPSLEAMKLVWPITLGVVDKCDVLLANLNHRARCFGSIREIQRAKDMGKRVVVVDSQLIDYPSLSTWDVELFATLDEALVAICGEYIEKVTRKSSSNYNGESLWGDLKVDDLFEDPLPKTERMIPQEPLPKIRNVVFEDGQPEPVVGITIPGQSNPQDVEANKAVFGTHAYTIADTKLPPPVEVEPPEHLILLRSTDINIEYCLKNIDGELKFYPFCAGEGVDFHVLAAQLGHEIHPNTKIKLEDFDQWRQVTPNMMVVDDLDQPGSHVQAPDYSRD